MDKLQKLNPTHPLKVAITARKYGLGQALDLELLRNAGCEVADYSGCEFGAGTPEEQLYDKVKDADVIIAGLEPYKESLLRRCERLKLISRRGIGFDTVDCEICRQLGITVCRTKGVVESAVAEQVIAYILYFARRIDLQNDIMHRGQWQQILVSGAKSRRIGLIGFGGIGVEIARRAAALQMQVVYYVRNQDRVTGETYGAQYLPLEELLRTSDYVSVNVPLTKETYGMIGRQQLNMMKKESVLINISRGGIVKEIDLRRALDENKIKGAAIDVFEREPCIDSPLIGCSRAVLTPHTASYTEENFAVMNLQAAQNVVDFIKGSLAQDQRIV